MATNHQFDSRELWDASYGVLLALAFLLRFIFMFMFACSLAFILAWTLAFAFAGLVAGLGDAVTVVFVLVLLFVFSAELHPALRTAAIKVPRSLVFRISIPSLVQ